MTNTEKCQPHGFTDCCNVVEEAIDPSECLNFGADCGGAVEYRYPLSGTGKSFIRCDVHWDERLNVQAGIDRRYPDSPMPPSDFDPYYAGESWGDDY
jgi:hypothetical protein